MDIAVARFGYAYEKMRLEDRLIDLVVAYESIFCEDAADLTHKISTRVARFIEKDPVKRDIVRKNIKEAYTIRSKIVHGRKQIAPGDFWLDDGTKSKLNTPEYLSLIRRLPFKSNKTHDRQDG